MRQALRLAGKGLGKTHPNPAVGCVIVKNGIVLGRGYHRRAGEPHAEIEALRKCPPGSTRGATCYVTMEPCNHHGRTPPCTEALLRAGISRVVAATRDSNPNIKGGGLEYLEQHGIHVTLGILIREAEILNESWIKWIRTGRPFVTLKIASSLDGKVATCKGESRWITNEKSRRHAHRIRSRNAAIMIGKGTAVADNPQLTARRGDRIIAAPLRIVIDTHLQIPPDLRLLNPDMPGRTIVAVLNTVDSPGKPILAERGIEWIECPPGAGGIDLDFLLTMLGQRGIESILVEGGPTLAFSLLKLKLVDKLMLYLAPILIGGRTARSSVEGRGFECLPECPELYSIRTRRMGKDFLLTAYLNGETQGRITG